MSAADPTICSWAQSDPLLVRYHDEEWGRPVFDEPALFELITLEGAQAGLSWLTVLRKREGYRKAFASFDPQRVAGFDGKRVDQLVLNPDIIRHRGKIESTINNARRILALWNNGQTLADICWELVDGKPLQNNWQTMADMPSISAASTQLSKRLKKLGFRFVGETTCYSFLQAAGLVNDHLVSCPQHVVCQSLASGSASASELASASESASASASARKD